ncbi:MAG: hypothetical protein AAFV29_06835, partial [Myxococcota bacterium]
NTELPTPPRRKVEASSEPSTPPRRKGDGDTVIDRRSPWAVARAQTRVATTPGPLGDIPVGPRAAGADNEPLEAPDVDEATLQDVSLRTLAQSDSAVETAQPISGRKKEAPTRRTVWDKADAVAPPPTKPVGPKGTVVGVRLINEPPGLRSGQSADMPAMLPPPQIISPATDRPTDLRPEPGMLPPPQVPVNPSAGIGGPAPLSSPNMGRPQILPGPQMTAGPTSSPMSIGQAMPPTHRPGYAHPPVTPPGVPTSDPHLLPGVSVVAPTTGNRAPMSDIKTPLSRPDIVSPTAASRTGSNILSALVFFGAGIAAAFAAQTYLLGPNAGPEMVPPPRTVQTIYPAGEILLQASPSNASVISEQDGRILGQTPMRFLVPADSNYAVLIAAKGHEPTRLVLPTRGRLRTDLVPLDDRPPCSVTVRGASKETLTGIGAEKQADDIYKITGATVLRSEAGNGAWLVRCPALGGHSKTNLPPRDAPTPMHLSVNAPSGATIFIDNEAKGTVPHRGKVKSGFVQVKAETLRKGSTERWIPLFAPTRLTMPNPRP